MKFLGKRLLLLNIKPLHTVFYVCIYWLKFSTKEHVDCTVGIHRENTDVGPRSGWACLGMAAGERRMLCEQCCHERQTRSRDLVLLDMKFDERLH